MSKKYISSEELIGLKFGRLKIMEILPPLNGDTHRRARCICDCGSEKICALTRLRAGIINSCGCLRRENGKKMIKLALLSNNNHINKLPPHLGTAKHVYNIHYSDGNLTFEQFLQLAQKNCFYCGAPPSNKANHYLYINNINRYSQDRIENGYYTYNGLDRVDNNRLHDYDNLVPCCLSCNKAKLNRTKEDFFNWIIKIYKLHCI